ncbi:hypothetical protein FSP39_014548 [Pinctada imbricata]|uniref:Uncharacterized protein n=1 Tax=Pinctada imbricata TaxID=66713 RepID=A0AA88XD22_PINIB|nr:hypothetical protein FSP39_014548 [Pinctada imbricata]
MGNGNSRPLNFKLFASPDEVLPVNFFGLALFNITAIAINQGPGDCGGCPLRHSDQQHLLHIIDRMPEPTRDKILSMCSEGRYSAACGALLHERMRVFMENVGSKETELNGNSQRSRRHYVMNDKSLQFGNKQRDSAWKTDVQTLPTNCYDSKHDAEESVTKICETKCETESSIENFSALPEAVVFNYLICDVT